MGTLMFDLYGDMRIDTLLKINSVVSRVTIYEGGRGGATITNADVIMYFDISEKEADVIISELEKEFSSKMMERLCPTYDDLYDCEDEEEE